MSRPDPLGDQIVAALPDMRRLSNRLCENRHDSDDLVQDTVVEALVMGTVDGDFLEYLNALMRSIHEAFGGYRHVH